MFVRVLRWWFPWLVVFGVSTALAYATDEAITGRAAPPLTSDTTRAASGRWMRVRSTGPDGQSVSVMCRIQPSLASVDEMVLAWDDVNEYLAEACEEVWTRAD